MCRDDGPGRIVGSKCGLGAWSLASQYFDGSILTGTPELAFASRPDGRYEIECDAVRGMYYRAESSTDMENYTPIEAEIRVGDASFQSLIDPSTIDSVTFFRITRLTTPTSGDEG